jgi:hypothetical protein
MFMTSINYPPKAKHIHGGKAQTEVVLLEVEHTWYGCYTCTERISSKWSLTREERRRRAFINISTFSGLFKSINDYISGPYPSLPVG